MPVILATQETEIRRIQVWSQPGQIVLWDPILKKPITKRAGGGAQVVSLEFKLQYQKKKKKKRTECLAQVPGTSGRSLWGVRHHMPEVSLLKRSSLYISQLPLT
jgi:hypothetical protein